jgi:hypothetical protein
MITNMVLMPVELSDKQWQQIVRFSRLPPEARVHIGRAIAFYRFAPDFQPSKIHTQLKKLNKQAIGLRDALKTLHDHHHAQVVLTLALKSSQRFETAMQQQAARRRLADITRELQELAEWLGAARDRVIRGSPGARSQAILVQFLVTELDCILKRFTGRNIMRSDKESKPGRLYVQAVCEIADPTIGRGSIDAAMKRQIVSRGKISG